MSLTATELVPIPAAPEGHVFRTIDVVRHSGPCGAVISGVNLAAELPEETIAEIRRALLDHLVIFFRAQSLSADEQVAFSRRFGPASPVPFVNAIPTHPEVIAVVREASETQGFAFGGIWHSDFSMLPQPPMGSILHALEVPPFGGDTLWANQYLAFENCSPGLQNALRGLSAVHSARDAYAPKMQDVHDMFKGMSVQTSDEANRTQVHPVVRVHGETRREALYVNSQYTIGLDQWWSPEEKLLLNYLYRHATQESFTCRWKWEVGDVAFWDNRCLQHMAMGDSSGHRRFMHRTTVAGETPTR